MELPLVPLGTALIPPLVAQAFALPTLPGLGGSVCVTDHLPILEPASAPRSASAAGGDAGGPAASAPAAPSSAPPTGAAPPASAAPRVPPWLAPYGGALLHHAHSQPSYSGQPTTSASTGAAAPYAPYHTMYVTFPPGAAPPYASALPGVFGGMPYAHHTYSHGAPACSVDTSAGAPPYGMRMAPGVQPANTESTEEDMGDGTARAVKRTRLVWTPQLHKRFEEAVSKLGPDKSIPKNIMQEMNVEGLTRENVASHLQKWRLQKKVSGKDVDMVDVPLGAASHCSMGSQGTLEVRA